MFGHHDDDDKQQPHDNTDAAPETADQAEVPENSTANQPVEPPPGAADASDAGTVHPDPMAGAPAADTGTPPIDNGQDDNAGSKSSAWQHPGAPLGNSQDQISDVISPAGGFPKRPTYQYPKGTPPPIGADDTAVSEDPANRDLIDVKEHALEELAPLLDKLDLPPEEKFRAVMMILQANDDKSLLKTAYETAHSIEDEDIRAQALFTIVNEVDYFTHQDGTPS